MAQSQPSAARDQVRNIVPGLIDLSERVLFGEVWERPRPLQARPQPDHLRHLDRARPREAACWTSAARARQWSDQKRTERSHHPSRLLRRLAGGDDRGSRRQGRVREIIADKLQDAREGEMKIGFIGLGMMGSGMAANLQKAGHELVVHDLRRAAAEPYLATGAHGPTRRAQSPRPRKSSSPRSPARPKSKRWRSATTACSAG